MIRNMRLSGKARVLIAIPTYQVLLSYVEMPLSVEGVRRSIPQADRKHFQVVYKAGSSRMCLPF